MLGRGGSSSACWTGGLSFRWPMRANAVSTPARSPISRPCPTALGHSAGGMLNAADSEALSVAEILGLIAGHMGFDDHWAGCIWNRRCRPLALVYSASVRSRHAGGHARGLRAPHDLWTSDRPALQLASRAGRASMAVRVPGPGKLSLAAFQLCKRRQGWALRTWNASNRPQTANPAGRNRFSVTQARPAGRGRGR
jgi:hypothetical protein